MWQTSSSTTVSIRILERVFLLPATLLLSFLLCQYFLAAYLVRGAARNPRIWLLVGSSVTAFGSLTVYGYCDDSITSRLAHVSDFCCLLMLSLQISIVGRNALQRTRIPVLARLMILTDLVALALISIIILHAIVIAWPAMEASLQLDLVQELVEAVSLCFVVGYRFFFLIKNLGIKVVLQYQTVETLVYLLLLCHQLPILLLRQSLGPSVIAWPYLQSFCMRSLLVISMLLSMRAKNGPLRAVTESGGRTNGPTFGALGGVVRDNSLRTGISVTDVNTWDRASDGAYDDYMLILEQVNTARVLPSLVKAAGSSTSSTTSIGIAASRRSRRMSLSNSQHDAAARASPRTRSRSRRSVHDPSSRRSEVHTARSGVSAHSAISTRSNSRRERISRFQPPTSSLANSATSQREPQIVEAET